MNLLELANYNFFMHLCRERKINIPLNGLLKSHIHDIRNPTKIFRSLAGPQGNQPCYDTLSEIIEK